MGAQLSWLAAAGGTGTYTYDLYESDTAGTLGAAVDTGLAGPDTLFGTGWAPRVVGEARFYSKWRGTDARTERDSAWRQRPAP